MDIVDSDGFTLFEYDPLTKRSVWMKAEDGRYIFRVDMPLDDIFDANAEVKALTEGQRFGEWNRFASMPLHLTYKTGVDDAVEQQDSRWLSRFFNNSDNSKWRTSRGKV